MALGMGHLKTGTGHWAMGTEKNGAGHEARDTRVGNGQEPSTCEVRPHRASPYKGEGSIPNHLRCGDVVRVGRNGL